MKTVIVASACALAIGLSGCGGPPPAPPPQKVGVGPDCPEASAGVLSGAPATTAVVDQIINTAKDGQPPSFRLQYVAGLGVCVDGATGDIHLYGDKATNAQFTVNFASSLSGQGSWPSDATQAVQVAYASDAPFGPPPPNAWNPSPQVLGGGSILIFTVPYEKGHNYRYHLQYNDASGNLQTIEAMVINN